MDIAVLTTDFSVEHNQAFIKGIFKYFEGTGVNVFFAQTRYGKDTSGIFEYQLWSVTELLKSKQIDGFIVASGIYCSNWEKEKLVTALKKYGNRPIVSASVDLGLDNSYTVLLDCEESIFEITRHLKECHGCKKMAFISAELSNSPESKERLNAFNKAAEKLQIELHPEYAIHSDFTADTTYELFKKRFPNKESVWFDSIISSSDYMATGAMNALKEIGLKCPEDYKLIGFDDAIYATLSLPKMSTVNQNVINQGSICAEILEKLLNGETVPKVTISPLYPVYRQSCGCIPLTETSPVYKDLNNELINEKNLKENVLDVYSFEILEKIRYTSLIDILNVGNTSRQLFFQFPQIIAACMSNSLAICLYKEPIYLRKKDDCSVPEEAELYMYRNNLNGKEVFSQNFTFNTSEKILDLDPVQDDMKSYYNVIYPIYAGEANYGYLCSGIWKENFSAYIVNLKLLASKIASSIEYTQSLLQNDQLSNENRHLLETNSNLYIQSKTDELTNVYNRRGFMEIGQKTVDITQEMNCNGIIAFIDLDGLKWVNDSFGHEMGDKALKLHAQVLKESFRSTDIVGRLSGDEFAVVAPGLTIEEMKQIKKDIDKNNESISISENLPFVLSTSIGVADFTSSTVLSQLLAKADKVLYEEKQIKHEKNPSRFRR